MYVKDYTSLSFFYGEERDSPMVGPPIPHAGSLDHLPACEVVLSLASPKVEACISWAFERPSHIGWRRQIKKFLRFSMVKNK